MKNNKYLDLSLKKIQKRKTSYKINMNIQHLNTKFLSRAFYK